ncbi:hypothetical protein PHYPSEUDO_002053 [Phytophthora pseudosyringae]|uniref:Uncharacterized protein n=1 Tax=Phytophthora pseudosyringae TaxID=221518 RepID=A0A8T1VUR3_9STRA|nr:hypothetical protein PHYPSEUDO_002053 [Phytophthora pseudosyringae]
MGVSTSSSSGDSDAHWPRTGAPSPPSSSSRSSASSGAVGSLANARVGDPVQVEDGSKSAQVPQGSSSGLLRLSSVGDDSDSDDSDSASASVAGSEGSSSCSDDHVEIEVVTPEPADWTASDRCPYYPPRSDGCTEPRSCRDCLNIDVGDEYSCMVNQYGRCVRQSHSTYVKALDFRQQQDSNDGDACEGQQKVQFPAGEVDYCPYGDKKCKQCRDSVFEDVMHGQINGSLTKFCYGHERCVCIAVCEAPIWKSTIGQTVCNGTVVNRDYESQHANTYGGSATDSQDGHGGAAIGNLMMEIVGGVAAAVVLIAAVMYVRRRSRPASDDSASGSSSNSGSGQAGSTQEGEDGAAGAAGSVPMAAPGAPTLSLFGWQAMRSELIEREQLLLAGVEDFSNVRTGYLQLLDVDASAPPPEEDESSAPVLLVPLAGASAPSFSPRALPEFPVAPSAPPVSPSAPLASPTLLEEQLL